MAGKTDKVRKPASLLVELLAEELPPRALKDLSEAFASTLFSELQRGRFLSGESAVKAFATPRRLAALITAVKDRSADAEREVQGPPVAAPAQAIAGFARKNGVAVEALGRRSTPRGEVYVARLTIAGEAISGVLSGMVETAVKALPIPKLMRWGEGEAQFVRPVHGLVMLHGAAVVPGRVLGLESGKATRGHRFMGKPGIALSSADEYETRLRKDGMVIAAFEARREEIRRQIDAAAKRLGARLGEHESLLDEVTALVEHPSVYVGEFDAAFLDVPHECLTLTMRQHQRVFPLFGGSGKLLPKFLIVSNIKVADPRRIVAGNERVVRPRLQDARFFYDQDRKVRLEARVPELAKVVHHHKLGSQRVRVDRLKLLSGEIAHRLGADRPLAERAAELCKADLLTGMVGEFPELQGVMGRYYALHDGEPREVADAIEAHYRPRFAGDRLPAGPLACSVALADKLDALAGMFAAGEAPTGDRDPYGLRRAALGVLRILMEVPLKLDVFSLVRCAEEGYGRGSIKFQPDAVRGFLTERLRNYLREQGEDALQVEAVIAQLGGFVYQAPARLAAVKQFVKLPEAKDLAAANKRVLNIIRKNEEIGAALRAPDRSLMREPAEIALMEAVDRLSPLAEQHFDRGDYAGSLRLLAGIKSDVDRFFDKVMVMVEDEVLRNNRAALLQKLGHLMNRVADISKLAA